jgi:hypothetical protein
MFEAGSHSTNFNCVTKFSCKACVLSNGLHFDGGVQIVYGGSVIQQN